MGGESTINMETSVWRFVLNMTPLILKWIVSQQSTILDWPLCRAWWAMLSLVIWLMKCIMFLMDFISSFHHYFAFWDVFRDSWFVVYVHRYGITKRNETKDGHQINIIFAKPSSINGWCIFLHLVNTIFGTNTSEKSFVFRNCLCVTTSLYEMALFDPSLKHVLSIISCTFTI